MNHYLLNWKSPKGKKITLLRDFIIGIYLSSFPSIKRNRTRCPSSIRSDKKFSICEFTASEENK